MLRWLKANGCPWEQSRSFICQAPPKQNLKPKGLTHNLSQL
jgi:hypothetical protein